MTSRREALRHLSWLAGVAAVPPAVLNLSGCAPDPAGADWTPQYFSAEEGRFLSAYVDTLLPRTETPGGLDVGVDRFIDRVMAASVPVNEQQTDGGNPEKSPMQLGMRDFDEDARAQYGKVFADLDDTQRGELFRAAEGSPRFQPQVWGTAVGEQPPISFYRSLKSFALWAYLSSEQIGTEVLNYDPVPGEYDGDIPLSSVGGKAWSL